MLETPREVTSAIRRHYWLHNAAVIGAALTLLWLLYVITLILGSMGYVLVTRRLGGTEHTWDSAGVLAFAAVATVILAPILIARLRTAAHLARIGVPVAGTVRRELGVTIRGTDTVLVSYTHEGVSYVKKLSRGLLHEAKPNRPIELLVDPEEPKRCMLRDAVLPPTPAAESGDD